MIQYVHYNANKGKINQYHRYFVKFILKEWQQIHHVYPENGSINGLIISRNQEKSP